MYLHCKYDASVELILLLLVSKRSVVLVGHGSLKLGVLALKKKKKLPLLASLTAQTHCIVGHSRQGKTGPMQAGAFSQISTTSRYFCHTADFDSHVHKLKREERKRQRWLWWPDMTTTPTLFSQSVSGYTMNLFHFSINPFLLIFYLFLCVLLDSRTITRLCSSVSLC